MATEKPTSILEWATNTNALKTEPADSLKRAGFPVSQPAVDHFNWVFFNIYKWLCFFDNNISGGGFLYHQHITARPRVQIPFALPDMGKLASLQVLKRENGSVAGISATAYSGDGTITAGSQSDPSLTFTAGNTNNRLYDNGTGTFAYSVAGAISTSETTVSGQAAVVTGTPVGSLFIGSGGDFDSGDTAWMRALTIIVSSGRLISSSFRESSDHGDPWPDLFYRNEIFLIAANSESDISLGDCVIWRLRSTTNQDIRSSSSTYDLNIDPVYKNIDISISLTVFRAAKAYTVVPGASSGSSLSSAVSLDNSSPFNLADYEYNPAAQTIVVTLSGTVSATAFHTLVIRQGGQDVISLLASDAAYNSTDMTFTWSGQNNDPLASGGTAMFVFQTSGSGLPVYNFVAVTAGLAVETYSDIDYLHIGTSSGVSNNDVVLIRRVGG